MLASGSTEGHLCVWDRDIAGFTRSRRPITAMKQPTAVKVSERVMCPEFNA